MRIDKPTLTKIATFTDNGFLKTSGSDGTLGVDTATYIASIADPNADRLFGWDDTDNAYKFIVIGTNLSYDHASHTLSASGGVSGATKALSNLASVAINTTLVSDTDNTDALGTAAIGWSDLWLGDGSVITWSSAPSTADVTLTHSANTLTLAGGDLIMATSLGATGTRVLKGWFTDLEVTNAIAGSITGNAAGSSATCVGNAGSATYASALTIANETGDTSCYPVFVTTTTGNLPGKSNTAFTFDAATVTLSSTIIHDTNLLTDHIGEHTGAHTVVFDNTITNAGQSDLTTVHSTTHLVDHIGEHTGSHTVVFDNTITLPATTTLPAAAQIVLTAPSGDVTCTGFSTSAFNSGYTSTAVGDLVYLDSSATWQKTDADATTTAYGLIGIALTVAATGNAVSVALPGSFVRVNAWNWTVGNTLYLGETAGAMQATIPTGADNVIRVVGFAVNADYIYFYPSQDVQTTVA